MNAEERQTAVRKVLATWPPLNDAQRARLTILLRPAKPTPAATKRPVAA